MNSGWKLRYQPKIGKLPITLAGEFFNGVSLHICRRIRSFSDYTGNTIKSVNGLDGDLPARRCRF